MEQKTLIKSVCVYVLKDCSLCILLTCKKTMVFLQLDKISCNFLNFWSWIKFLISRNTYSSRSLHFRALLPSTTTSDVPLWVMNLPTLIPEGQKRTKIDRKYDSTVIWSKNVAISVAKHVQIVDTLSGNVCLLIRKYFKNIVSRDNNVKNTFGHDFSIWRKLHSANELDL